MAMPYLHVCKRLSQNALKGKEERTRAPTLNLTKLRTPTVTPSVDKTQSNAIVKPEYT